MYILFIPYRLIKKMQHVHHNHGKKGQIEKIIYILVDISTESAVFCDPTATNRQLTGPGSVQARSAAERRQPTAGGGAPPAGGLPAAGGRFQGANAAPGLRVRAAAHSAVRAVVTPERQRLDTAPVQSDAAANTPICG